MTRILRCDPFPTSEINFNVRSTSDIMGSCLPDRISQNSTGPTARISQNYIFSSLISLNFVPVKCHCWQLIPCPSSHPAPSSPASCLPFSVCSWLLLLAWLSFGCCVSACVVACWVLWSGGPLVDGAAMSYPQGRLQHRLFLFIGHGNILLYRPR